MGGRIHKIDLTDIKSWVNASHLPISRVHRIGNTSIKLWVIVGTSVYTNTAVPHTCKTHLLCIPYMDILTKKKVVSLACRLLQTLTCKDLA